MPQRFIGPHLSLVEFIEEFLVDVEGGAWLEAEFQLLEHLKEFVPVHKFNGRRAIPARLPSCILREASGGEDDALLSTAKHGTSEIPDHGSTDTSFVALALKKDFEGHKGVDFENPFTINTVVTGSSSDQNLLKSRFAQETLAEAFESGKVQVHDHIEKLLAIAG